MGRVFCGVVGGGGVREIEYLRGIVIARIRDKKKLRRRIASKDDAKGLPRVQARNIALPFLRQQRRGAAQHVPAPPPLLPILSLQKHNSAVSRQGDLLAPMPSFPPVSP